MPGHRNAGRLADVVQARLGICVLLSCTDYESPATGQSQVFDTDLLQKDKNPLQMINFLPIPAVYFNLKLIYGSDGGLDPLFHKKYSFTPPVCFQKLLHCYKKYIIMFIKLYTHHPLKVNHHVALYTKQ